MKNLKFFLAALCLFGSIATLTSVYAADMNQNAIPVNFQLMDHSTFQKIVVGNTIVGVTSNSKSLYLLYFAKDGVCEMWKGDKVYPGSWWAEKDELGRDFFRAYWPEYSSGHKDSKFSSPNTGKSDATSAWYYVDSKQSDTLIVATKTYRTPVLVLPGRAFPAP